MAHIGEDVEIRTQKLLPKSVPVVVDDGVLYSNFYFFRYVEGSRHITGDCHVEFIGGPDRWYWLPWIARELFAPKRFVLELESPVRWDNEDDPIPEQQLNGILSRLDRALRKKCRRYKIDIAGKETVSDSKRPAVTR